MNLEDCLPIAELECKIVSLGRRSLLLHPRAGEQPKYRPRSGFLQTAQYGWPATDRKSGAQSAAARDSGHVTWVDRGAPREKTMATPSRSRSTCLVAASALTGVMSKRIDGIVPPSAKNTSRMTPARWNCARSPLDAGADAASADCARHVLPDMSTYGRSKVFTKPSNKAPGANSRAKSATETSSMAPGANG